MRVGSGATRFVCVALAVAGVAAAVAPSAGAISRARANQIALATLKPQRITGQVDVLGLPQPLAAGSRVYDAAIPTSVAFSNGNRTSVEHHRGLARPAWLFWADYAHGARFEHPGTIVLVDDRSGRVVTREPTRWYPLVNGKRPAFMTPAGYNGQAYVVWPAAKRARMRASSAQTFVAPHRRRVQLKDDCLVMIGDKVDPQFQPDLTRLRGAAAQLGLEANEVLTVEGLRLRIGVLVRVNKPPCKDVWIHVSGHGSSAESSGVPATTISYKVKDAAGTVTKVEQTITGPELVDIIESFRELATFKVTFDSCYSGRWVEYFHVLRLPNVKIVTGSSSKTELSWGRIKSGTPGQPGKHESGEISNTTTNPVKAGEFSNGMATGIEQVLGSNAETALTKGDLALILNRAFQLELSGDFAAQLGWTHPQVYFNPSAGTYTPPQRQWEVAPVAGGNPYTSIYGVGPNGYGTGATGSTKVKPILFKFSKKKNDPPKEIPLPSTLPFGSGFGVNGKGHVAGSMENADGTVEHPFLFDGGKVLDLGTLGGALASGNAINGNDQVVGSSLTNAPNTFHPFLWQSGTMKDLGTLGGQNGSAFGINSLGQVTGSGSIPGPSGFHAFVWNGAMRDLGALPGYENSAGLAINDGGLVAGYSTNIGGLHLATLWGSMGPIPLGTLPGDKGSDAKSINNAGWIVGNSFLSTRTLPHPFLWAGGVMYPLDSLLPPGSGWTLYDALSVNEFGQIGGDGLFQNQVQGFLFSPPLADELVPLANAIEAANLAKPVDRRTSLGYFLRAAIVDLDAGRALQACTDLARFGAAAPMEAKGGFFRDPALVTSVADLRFAYGCP